MQEMGEFLSHWGVKKESPVLFVTVSLCLAVSGSCLHAGLWELLVHCVHLSGTSRPIAVSA